MSIRDELLGLVSQPARLEPVHFFGKSVFVREMTGAERDAFEAAQVEAGKDGKALVNFRARLLVQVLVDETGARIFTDADAAEIGKLPARGLSKPFDVASKVNSLTPEDERELGKK